MNVLYKCSCMDKEATVWVRDRNPEEDVVHWVEHIIGEAIGADHRERSPLCIAKATEYVKIPLEDENKGIGFRATRQ